MKVVKNSIIYLGSSILNKAIPLFLLPIMTKYLLPSEFGILSIFQLVLSFFIALIGMNVQVNISKSFFKYSKNDLAKLLSNILLLIFLIMLICLLLLIVSSFFIDKFFSISFKWILLMPLLSFMFMVNVLNLTLYRNEGNAYKFGIFEITSTIINVSITILFLVSYNYGWKSQVFGIAGSYILFFIIGIKCLIKRGFLTFVFEKMIIKSIIITSIPMIPHALATIVIAVSDRLFIEKMVGLESVGIYSVGYMFGMIVVLFTDAFIKAWVPWFYKGLNDTNNVNLRKITIVRYSYLYIISTFMLAFIISMSAKFILPHYVDPKFYSAKNYIFIIALGYAIHGIYKILLPYLVHIDKTSLIAVSTSIAAILNLFLNYIFIKIFGTIGAAYATVVAFSISTSMLIYFQNKLFPMPWLEFRKIF